MFIKKVLTENIDVTAETKTFVDVVNNDLTYGHSKNGYKFFNKDCVNRRGGGVALYIATWLNPIEISPNYSNIEHVCVKVTREKFGSPTGPLGQTQEFDIEMYQVLQQSLHNNESVMLGDFSLLHNDWQTLTVLK